MIYLLKKPIRKLTATHVKNNVSISYGYHSVKEKATKQ